MPHRVLFTIYDSSAGTIQSGVWLRILSVSVAETCATARTSPGLSDVSAAASVCSSIYSVGTCSPSTRMTLYGVKFVPWTVRPLSLLLTPVSVISSTPKCSSIGCTAISPPVA